MEEDGENKMGGIHSRQEDVFSEGVTSRCYSKMLVTENRAGRMRFLKAIIYGLTGGPKIAWLFVARPNRNNRSLTHILRCGVTCWIVR